MWIALGTNDHLVRHSEVLGTERRIPDLHVLNVKQLLSGWEMSCTILCTLSMSIFSYSEPIESRSTLSDFPSSLQFLNILFGQITKITNQTKSENTLDQWLVKKISNPVVNVELIKFSQEVQPLVSFTRKYLWISVPIEFTVNLCLNTCTLKPAQ